MSNDCNISSMIKLEETKINHLELLHTSSR